MNLRTDKLALLGGEPYLQNPPEELMRWPIITEEDEAAILDVVRRNAFSLTDVTAKFEKEFAQWIGRDFALAYTNGTMSITAAMYALGLRPGDEVICPTKTYWGSVSQTLAFGAVPVFCNITENFVIDPDDIERCISEKTKMIVVVHYCSYPCDMDRIMEIAKKHNLLVLEDVSHAQGGMYKGKKLGTFGDIAAMSLMSMKAFAAGELGILVTDKRKYYERALAFGHYERNNPDYIFEDEEMMKYPNIALGGFKGRANQVCTAMARVQLKYYDERIAENRKAMNYLYDLLEGTPGLRMVRVDESTGSNMAGFYNALFGYKPEELHGLSSRKFCEALRAEGIDKIWEGGNFCLHTHRIFKDFDLYHTGAPSRIAHASRDVREMDEACEKSAELCCLNAPWIKKYDKEWIEKYAEAIKKVVRLHEDLLPYDLDKRQGGRWYGTENM